MGDTLLGLSVTGNALGPMLFGSTLAFRHERSAKPMRAGRHLALCRAQGITAVRMIAVTSKGATHLIDPAGGCDFDVDVVWASLIEEIRF